MALLMVTKRTVSSSTLLGRVLGGGRHPSSGLSSRSFSGRRYGDVTDRENRLAVADPDRSTQPHEISITSGLCDSSTKNPLQTSGPKGAYEVKQVEEGLFVRMEMPGIDKEDVKVWADYDRNVFVKAEGKAASKYGEIARTYSAKIQLPSSLFKKCNLQPEIENGILRMLIPKSSDKYEIKLK